MLGYRKFTVALSAVLCSTVLMYFGKIADGVYSTVVCAALVAYLGANVAQKLKQDQ